MRPDLAKVHARIVDFSCELTPGAEQLERLQAALGHGDEYKEFPWLFLSRYRASHSLHTAWAMVSARREGVNRLGVEFTVAAGRRIRAEFEARPVADLTRALGEWGVQATFDCSVRLLYPEKGWVSRISLPMRLFEHADLPFDEFRGFRAVKVENGKTTYSIIVDRPENKAVSHVVLFSHTATITEDLADAIVGQAVRISSLFVHEQGE